jgi:hypothetical protein
VDKQGLNMIYQVSKIVSLQKWKHAARMTDKLYHWGNDAKIRELYGMKIVKQTEHKIWGAYILTSKVQISVMWNSKVLNYNSQ